MKRRGFTLIELLVVIAIIAILAAILFPIFANAKQQSYRTMCSYNLRQLTYALLGYADDWHGYLPGLDAFGDLFDTAGNKPNRGPMWQYVKAKGVFSCPLDPYRYKMPDPNHPEYGLNFTYSMNGYMTVVEDTSRDAANTQGAPLSKSKNSRMTIFLIDENVDPNKNENKTIVNDALFIWDDRTADRHPGLGPHSETINNAKVIVTGVGMVSYLDGHTGIVPGLYKWNQHKDIFCR